MLRYYYLYLVSFLVIFMDGCHSSTTKPNPKSIEHPSNSNDNANHKSDLTDSTKVLNNNEERLNSKIEITKEHIFSNPLNPDKFIIEHQGDTLLTSHITFKIIQESGKEIYTETFTATSLLNYSISPEASVADKEAFIRKRIQTFFDNKNFSKPAIPKNEVFNKNYMSERVFEELKNKNEAVAFNYLLGEEDGRKIVYSDNLKKVVLLYNCC